MILTLDRQHRPNSSYINLGGILRFTQPKNISYALDKIPHMYDRIIEFVDQEVVWHEGRAEFTLVSSANYFIGDITRAETVQGKYAVGSTFKLDLGTKVVLSSDSGFHKLRITLEEPTS